MSNKSRVITKIIDLRPSTYTFFLCLLVCGITGGPLQQFISEVALLRSLVYNLHVHCPFYHPLCPYLLKDPL